MKRIQKLPVYIFLITFTRGFRTCVNIKITLVRLKVKCPVSFLSHSVESCGTCFRQPGIVFHNVFFIIPFD